MLQQLLLNLVTCMRDLPSQHKVDNLEFIVNDPEITCEFHRWGVYWLRLYEGMTMRGGECLCIGLNVGSGRVHLGLMLLCQRKGGSVLQCLD